MPKTGRKIRELHSSIDESRIDALAALAGGVAHDVNNVLASIMVVASAMESEIDPENPFRSDLRDILNACGRGTRLTRSLLQFARRHQLRCVALDCNDLARNVGSALLAEREGVTASYDLCNTPLPVRGDADLLREALENVVRNAIESLEGDGTISIRTAVARRTASDCPPGFDATSGLFARIAVSDTGRGMTLETVERAFEPFFTTKSSRRGAGLGLAVAYGAVRRHLGVIELDSQVGVGTIVRIDLPLLP